MEKKVTTFEKEYLKFNAIKTLAGIAALMGIGMLLAKKGGNEAERLVLMLLPPTIYMVIVMVKMAKNATLRSMKLYKKQVGQAKQTFNTWKPVMEAYENPNEINDKINGLERQIKVVEKEKDSLHESCLSLAKKNESLTKNARSLMNENESLKENGRSLAENLRSLTARCKSLMNENESLKIRCENSQPVIDSLNEKIESLEAEKLSLQNSANNVKGRYKKLKEEFDKLKEVEA